MQPSDNAISGTVPFSNKVLVCPSCKGKLEHDKHPVASGNGFIYRKRICVNCHATVFTKQGREEVTGVEMPSDSKNVAK